MRTGGQNELTETDGQTWQSW